MWFLCNIDSGTPITFLQSWAFSAVNHWVLQGHCDSLRNFLTLFVINFRHLVFVLSYTSVINRKQPSQGHNFSTINHKYSWYSNRKVCDRSQGKCPWSQTILWLIKDTFSLWSVTNVSMIDYRTFWLDWLEEITSKTVHVGKWCKK